MEERILGTVFLRIGPESATAIDVQDLLSVIGWRLTLHADQRGRPYVAARKYVDGTREFCSLHRLIMGLTFGDKRMVDHIDGDGLNNRRSNLRIATVTQNQWNRRANKSPDRTSRFKGVGFYPNKNCWRARITIDGKPTHIGYFLKEIDAAKAYDEVASRVHGEFSLLNFQKESE